VTIGPVELLVIDVLAVRKDAHGTVEALRESRSSPEERHSGRSWAP
jgi:hypothetical protein